MRNTGTKILGGLALVALSAALGYGWHVKKVQSRGDAQIGTTEHYPEWQPAVPELFAADIPSTCQQLMLVLSPEETSIPATLYLMERAASDQPWTVIPEGGIIPVTLGRSGLAWGVGEHRSATPAAFREKREGDGCSPAGVFRVPFTFGIGTTEMARTESPALKLPYTALEDAIIGVDDPKSKYYNQVVDSRTVVRDWDSHEPMNRFKKLYRWGAFIAHNPEGVPGLGSCIFIHIWPGPGEPTAGCTGMADPDVVRVLTWLDPAKEPRLVQWVLDVDDSKPQKESPSVPNEARRGFEFEE